MMDLDPRRLLVLHAVALRGGVTAAAESLRISPSAVSQQLAQLEREAGCDLVERAGRGISLTPAGRALAARAEEVLHALDRAAAAVDTARSGVSGTVLVGAIPSAAGALVGPAAARAHARHPALDVRISEGEDDASLVELRLTALDMVVMQEYDHVPVRLPAGLAVTRLAVDPLCLVTPATGPWAGAGPLADLHTAPWVASAPDTPCGRATRQACRDAGFEPDIRHTAIDFAMTVDLVEAGLGVALVPEMGLRRPPAGIRIVPTEPPLRRTIFAVTRSAGVGALRPAVAALLGELISGPGAPVTADGERTVKRR